MSGLLGGLLGDLLWLTAGCAHERGMDVYRRRVRN